MTLTPAQIALVRRAHAACVSGQPQVAAALLADLGDALSQSPDALQVLAIVHRTSRNMPAAAQAYAQAVRLAPKAAPLWAAYGNHLHDMGDAQGGLQAMMRATALRPDHADGWIDMAIIAIDVRDFAQSAYALDMASRAGAVQSRILDIRGAMEQARGVPDAAAECYRLMIAASPGDARAYHNLATSLRADDRREDALVAVETAIKKGLHAPQAFTLRAHLLAEVGRADEAVAQYRDVLRAHPGYLDAHDTLARLLPQVGRADEAMDAFDKAIAVLPGNVRLMHAAMQAAMALRQSDRAIALSDAIAPLIADRDDVAITRIQAMVMQGDLDRAIDLGRQAEARNASRAGLQSQLGQMLLTSGNLRQAEHHIAQAIAQHGTDQKAWALRTLIWRLCGDDREEWLAGYDDIASIDDIGTPHGWSHQDDFLADLAVCLDGLHVTSAHPSDQTVRGGTQTRGNLFDRRRQEPVMALQRQLAAVISNRLHHLRRDAGHPFLSRNSGQISFGGAWSVRLRQSGHHVGHFHPQGWLSSAFYVALPSALPDEDGDAGALMLGVPDKAIIPGGLTPRRILRPIAGSLALFPSYMWHGTAPFGGNAIRLTVAFDALPA